MKKTLDEYVTQNKATENIVKSLAALSIKVRLPNNVILRNVLKTLCRKGATSCQNEYPTLIIHAGRQAIPLTVKKINDLWKDQNCIFDKRA